MAASNHDKSVLAAMVCASFLSSQKRNKLTNKSMSPWGTVPTIESKIKPNADNTTILRTSPCSHLQVLGTSATVSQSNSEFQTHNILFTTPKEMRPKVDMSPSPKQIERLFLFPAHNTTLQPTMHHPITKISINKVAVSSTLAHQPSKATVNGST
jgi:hypothetical protein